MDCAPSSGQLVKVAYLNFSTSQNRPAISESCQGFESHWYQPSLGCGHNLHPAVERDLPVVTEKKTTLSKSHL
jgi:hypothetical protein